MKLTTSILVVMLAVATAAAAQTPPAAQAGKVIADKQAADAASVQRQIVVDKPAAELQQVKMSVVARVTKGAPYSAETVTESVQNLADGNRIANRTTTRVYRDSEGRTRTEQIVGNEAVTVSISDPVSGTTYMMSPASRTAYTNGAVIVTPNARTVATVTPEWSGFVTTTKSGDAVRTETREFKLDEEKRAAAAAKAGSFTYTVASGGVSGNLAYAFSSNDGNTTREDLGEQPIEGVGATGTRTTTVIPAGAIGNERPISIVSEEWFCKDLGILVLTRHSDPRSGETTYRVTNISRVEPDPSLFEVPPDYKVQQSMIKREGR